ncbi:MAG: YggS family pyridoxal phosphate-dependent enzyme [Chloroflexota bacterium]
MADACARAGRDPAAVSLVAVTKTVPVERVHAAVEAGLTTFGENRVQEAESKAPLVDGAEWHLIGPLQSNKERRALATFGVIESVGSTEQLARLGRLARERQPRRPYPVLLQVNVDRDPAKAGFRPEALEATADGVTSDLEIRGLMTVGRLVDRVEEARPTFVALRELSIALRARWPALGPDLSMGMSDDFPIAIEEGATIVRVGRALFGDRPHA